MEKAAAVPLGLARQLVARARASSILAALLLGLSLLGATSSVDKAEATEVFEDFETDPGWDGRLNRPDPYPWRRVTQDFGWSATTHTGGEEGEIGGSFMRTLRPAWYARPWEGSDDNLNKNLAAKGELVVGEGSGVVGLGWFHTSSRDWRQSNSMLIRISGKRQETTNWASLILEMGTSSGRADGSGENRIFLERNRPYTWEFRYDRTGGGDGFGEARLTVDGETATETKVLTMELDESFRDEGAVFNRFGLQPMRDPGGGPLELWVDGFPREPNVETYPFNDDPHWDGEYNRDEQTNSPKSYDDAAPGIPDFGWKPPQGDFWTFMDMSGGAALGGEAGGLIWRVGNDHQRAWYGDEVGPLNLSQHLVASGRLRMTSASIDAGFWFGWFNTELAQIPQPPPPETGFTGDVLAIGSSTPSRQGHRIYPLFQTRTGIRDGTASGAPMILTDGKPYYWSIEYKPTAIFGGDPNAVGEIDFWFDDDPVFVNDPNEANAFNRKLKIPANNSSKTVFNRFGFLAPGVGGSSEIPYVDNLIYTAGP